MRENFTTLVYRGDRLREWEGERQTEEKKGGRSLVPQVLANERRGNKGLPPTHNAAG